MIIKDISVFLGLFLLFFAGIKSLGKRWTLVFSVLLFVLLYFFLESHNRFANNG